MRDEKEDTIQILKEELLVTKADNAGLVAALDTLLKETKGILHAHEMAIRYDSGNSNWACLEIAFKKSEQALASSTSGKELLYAVRGAMEVMDKISWTHIQMVSNDRIIQQTNIDNLKYSKDQANEALSALKKALGEDK